MFAIFGVLALLAFVLGIYLWGRKSSERREKATSLIISTVVIVVVIAGQELVWPKVKVWNEIRTADEMLTEEPVFSALKRYDPAAYEEFLSSYRQSLKEGKDKFELVSLIRNQVGSFVEKRVGRSSDEAATAFVESVLLQLRELEAIDPDLCYFHLFPDSSGSIIPAEHLSKTTMEGSSKALAEIIRTSVEEAHPAPGSEEVVASLQASYQTLVTIYGDELNMLASPYDADVDKGKVCAMAQDLYEAVLALPPEKSGRTLRFMFSQT